MTKSEIINSMPEDGEKYGGQYEDMLNCLRLRLGHAETVEEFILNDYLPMRNEAIELNHMFPNIPAVDQIGEQNVF